MIDYNKLQEAHNLAYKLAIKTKVDSVSIGVEQWADDLLFTLDGSLMCGDGEGFYSLDELILRIKELTQPEPKYNVGDTVFLLGGDENPVYSFKVDEIINENGVFWYLKYTEKGGYSDGSLSFDQWREDCLYPSREALIQSQIDYWSELMKPTQVSDIPSNFSRHKKCGCAGCNGLGECNYNECVHESDGKIYANYDFSCNDPYKCKKCGEFYR